jgi:hypothetical protein
MCRKHGPNKLTKRFPMPSPPCSTHRRPEWQPSRFDRRASINDGREQVSLMKGMFAARRDTHFFMIVASLSSAISSAQLSSYSRNQLARSLGTITHRDYSSSVCRSPIPEVRPGILRVLRPLGTAVDFRPKKVVPHGRRMVLRLSPHDHHVEGVFSASHLVLARRRPQNLMGFSAWLDVEEEYTDEIDLAPRWKSVVGYR